MIRAIIHEGSLGGRNEAGDVWGGRICEQVGFKPAVKEKGLLIKGHTDYAILKYRSQICRPCYVMASIDQTISTQMHVARLLGF